MDTPDSTGSKFAERIAIELRPRSYLAHYNLAKAYLALGDTANAKEQASDAMKLSPSPDIQALLHQIAAATPSR